MTAKIGHRTLQKCKGIRYEDVFIVRLRKGECPNIERTTYDEVERDKYQVCK